MRVRSLTGVGSRICHKSRIHIKFYRKVHATLPMQNSEAIPFKELSFVKLALYKWLSFEFIIQLSAQNARGKQENFPKKFDWAPLPYL